MSIPVPYERFEGEVLPEWIDLFVVIVFSLVIFYWAVNDTMSHEKVQAAVARDSAQIDFVSV